LEVGITYIRILCNDFTGPARFRLNMPEVALELKRVWHPCVRASSRSNSARYWQARWRLPVSKPLTGLVALLQSWILVTIFETRQRVFGMRLLFTCPDGMNSLKCFVSSYDTLFALDTVTYC